MELQDKIGRQQLVDKMEYLIKNLPQDEHFCLALDGEWGSGKSFVMGMLRERLKEHSEYIVINYDAWKNNFYSDPLIAILSCIIDAMQEKLSEINGFQEAVKAAGKEAMNSFLKSNKQAGKIASFIKTIVHVINRVQKPFQKDTTKGSISEFKSYQSLLSDVQDCLTKITEYHEYQNKVNKIIILVDEIDRCLPNEQLIVLERLHHLFSVKNCAVIVALNKKAIYSTFDNQYGGNGIEYLRKFFSYNFIVETEYPTFLRNLIKDFIDDINNSKKQDYVYTEQEIDPLISALLNEFRRISLTYKFSYSNRDIQNYFNKFHRIWEKDKPLNIVYIGFLLFMILYKQYEEAYFQAYKEGIWNNNPPKTFNFGDKIQPSGEYPFSYGEISASYPLYNNSFCNKFTSFMNSVRFRNDRGVYNWFQILNSKYFYHLYVFDEKDRANIEECFKTIENYGTMTKGN